MLQNLSVLAHYGWYLITMAEVLISSLCEQHELKTQRSSISITTLRRSFSAIALAFLISSGGMGRNNNLVSAR
jgi:hypothetical protein